MSETGSGGDILDAEAAAVLARHQEELLRRPSVVGVAVAARTRGDKPTREPCLVVYVERKTPESQLDEGEALPLELDGIPVDVVEVRRVESMPS